MNTTIIAPVKRVKLHQLILPSSPFKRVEMPKRWVWSSSSVKAFRKCKRKWFWKYFMGLKPLAPPPPLLIGKAFHATLGEWYRGKRSKIGPITARFHTELKQELNRRRMWYKQDDIDRLEAAILTFPGMMIGYERQYANDKQKWNIKLDSIEKFVKINMGDFDFTSQIDLVATPTKAAMVVEHKTVSKIQESYIKRLPLDTQIRGYKMAADYYGFKVGGVLYDVVRKCKLRRKSNETPEGFATRVAEAYVDQSPDYFYREPLMFDNADIEALKMELHQTHAELMNVIKQPGWDDPRSWLPNDAVCDEYFRLCEYHTACTTGVDQATASYLEQTAAFTGGSFDNLAEEEGDD